ncbi:MAG: DinB family protein, partial [Acidimicrobiales bacterium]
ALEYAAHVRDVFGTYDQRVQRSLVEDGFVAEGPSLIDAVEAGRYNDLDPATVADDLAANADGLAATYEAIPADGWERVHVRLGFEWSVLFTGRRAVHEGNHHLLDIGRGLRAVRELHKGDA